MTPPPGAAPSRLHTRGVGLTPSPPNRPDHRMTPLTDAASARLLRTRRIGLPASPSQPTDGTAR